MRWPRCLRSHLNADPMKRSQHRAMRKSESLFELGDLLSGRCVRVGGGAREMR